VLGVLTSLLVERGELKFFQNRKQAKAATA